MDRIIRTSTEYFLNKLDNNREYHTPVQLLEAGLPEYLVQRIRLELMRNLQESVKPPQSDWANMAAESVTQAWDPFLQAIREEIRLPSSYAGSVMESALSDILELLVTPRAFLPDYLFGNKQTLELSEVRERCEWIVVYRYFSGAIPRFMEKKGRNTLTKEQADRIIERLDERVTSHYTSLNWGQLFEPWFTLMGEQVDPSLFAAFFRDKGKPGVARLFDAEPEPIHRTRLIEILSRPQLDDDDDISDLETVEHINERSDTGKSTQNADEERVKPILIPAVEAPGKSRTGERSEFNKTTGTSDENTEQGSTGKGAGLGADLEDRSYPEDNKRSGSDAQKRDTQKDKSKGKAAGEGNLLARFSKPDGVSEEEPLYSRLKKDTDEEDQPLYSRLKKDTDDDDQPLYSQLKNNDDEEEQPLYSRLNSNDDDTDDDGQPLHSRMKKDDDDGQPLYSRLKKEDDEEDQPLYFRLKNDDDEEESPLYSRLKPDSEDDSSDEVPIWQRFTEVHPDTSDDEDNSVNEWVGSSKKKPADEDEITPGSDSEDTAGPGPVTLADFKTVADPVTESDHDTDRGTGSDSKSDSVFESDPASGLQEIRVHVKDMEQQFIDELFGGDENAFLESLGEIAQCSDWKQAGKYISKEIFDRNMIDIYSDTAIYFTDRMQTYFLERSM